MQSFDYKKYLPTLLIIVGFAIISIAFCLPAYKDMVLSQGDISSWKGMSHEAKEWHEKTGENTLWSNSMFGGGPTYVYYVPEGNNLISPVQMFVTSLFKKPAYFFFLAMISFFVFASVLKIDKWLGAVGAIAFAFTAFSVISITAGHDTKILSIAYIPAVLAGVITLYRGKYVTGGALFALALTLMFCNVHWQVVYYTIFIIFIMVIGFLIKAITEKKLKQFIIASLVALASGGAGAATIGVLLLPTMELNKYTMRGGKSDLTLNKTEEDKKKTGGLDKDYAFQWSNSPGEVFCMLVPYLYGGGDNEPAEKAPEATAAVQLQRAPMYWGPQPFLAGPMNYVGAIVVFLFVLGMLVIRNRMKWALAAAALLGILLSMGKHFSTFNYWIFDHLPMFHSFRTPSMAHAIPLVIFPLIAVWGVNEIIKQGADRKEMWKQVKIAAGITAGLALLLGVGGNVFLDFTSKEDHEHIAKMFGAQGTPEQVNQLINLLKQDRAALAMQSGIKSAVYILLAAALLWAFIKDKFKQPVILVAGLGLLIAVDIFTVDAQYMNEEDSYVDASASENEFQKRPVDEKVLADPDPYYRVLDLTANIYADAHQAYYHKVIGGYSPAKLEIYQDLIDLQMGGAQSNNKFNTSVLAMLNTKHVIYSPQGEEQIPACGNAWFVNEVKWTKTADEDMLALNGNGLKLSVGAVGDTTAVANPFNPMTTAVMRDTFKAAMNGYTFGKDSAAGIKLTKYGLNQLEYESVNSQNGLAVFSDIYYPAGWHASVDGKETPIMKANYVLRAIQVPAGKHKIVFNFHPDTYYTGNTLSLIGSVLVIALCISAIVVIVRTKKEPETDTTLV